MTRDEAAKEVERLASLGRDWIPPEGVTLAITEHLGDRPFACYQIDRGCHRMAFLVPAPAPRANRERVHEALDATAEQLGCRHVVLDRLIVALKGLFGTPSHVLDLEAMGVG